MLFIYQQAFRFDIAILLSHLISRLEALASRLEAIAIRLEAIFIVTFDWWFLFFRGSLTCDLRIQGDGR